MVTAKKLPDGLMYLVETNPHETPDGEGVYIDEIPEWDDFERAHPPILALFKCTEGQRFEDGEVQKIRIPSYSGYTIKGKQMGLDVEYGYTLKSDKGGEVVEGKKESTTVEGLQSEIKYLRKGLHDIANNNLGDGDSCRNIASNILNHYI